MPSGSASTKIETDSGIEEFRKKWVRVKGQSKTDGLFMEWLV
jgi:hypothetical protein